MFGRLPVAGKLTIALVPLILAVIGLGTAFSYQTYQSVEGQQVTAKAADAMLAAYQTLDAIDNEVSAGLETTAGKVVDQQTARVETNDAVDRLEASITGVPIMVDGTIERVRSTITDARALVDAGGIDGGSLYERYSSARGDVLTIADALPSQASDQALFNDLAALRSIIDVRHLMDTQQILLLDVVSGRLQVTADEEVSLIRIGELSSRIDEGLAEFQAAAGGAWDAELTAATEAGDMAETASLIDGLVVSASESETGSSTGSSTGIIEWISRLDSRGDRVGDLAGQVSESVIGEAQGRAALAQQRVILIAGGTAIVVLLAILLTSVVAHSIVRRVREVVDRARHVTENQIPLLMDALENPRDDVDPPTLRPIRDSSRDELGELSRSFNIMQLTIDDVARRQIVTLRKGVAEIFVSLARRNRTLVDRQLAVIDELEGDETDSRTLANLYRLDHLATRMRRNAENLLVLAGSENPRRWQMPVALDDCVRAAISEVEEYRRVDILTLEPIAIRSRAVTDLSHLLAELIDNAANFSPPQTRVRVAGFFDQTGYLLTISDSGVGMSPERMDELNQLLSTPPVIGLALDPTLGLYVVARLAGRHGVEVRIVRGAPGVTAQVRIPASIYEPVAAAETPIRPQLDLRPRVSTRSEQRVTEMETRSDRTVNVSQIDHTPRTNGPPEDLKPGDLPVRVPLTVAGLPDHIDNTTPGRTNGVPEAKDASGPVEALPTRHARQSLPIPGEEGASRSDRSAQDLRNAFSHFQQGSQTSPRRGTGDDQHE